MSDPNRGRGGPPTDPNRRRGEGPANDANRRRGEGPPNDPSRRRGDGPPNDPNRRRGEGPTGGASSGPGERVIFGAGPVRELLARKAKAIKAIWVDPKRADRSTSDAVAGIVTTARAAGIHVEDRDRPQLDKASDGALHQGVVAWLGEFSYSDIDTMLAAATGKPLLVALDGVEDPRNLGAIIRSAYLLGAHGILIPEHRAAGVTPLVAKTSAGASELLPIAQVGNLTRWDPLESTCRHASLSIL